MEQINSDINIIGGIPDFSLIEAVRTLAEYYINAVRTMTKTVPDFAILFGTEAMLTGKLHEFSGKVNEGNFLDTAVNLLDNKDAFEATIRKIEKVEKFIKTNLQKARNIKRFVDELKIELEKANAVNDDFKNAITVFDSLYGKSVIGGYKEIIAEGQKLKDFYHTLMVDANKKMSGVHRSMLTSAKTVQAEIKKYPENLNRLLNAQVQGIVDYAAKRINDEVKLDYTIKCSTCHLSLSEMISYTALAPQKLAELQVAEMSIGKEAPPAPAPLPAGNGAGDSSPAQAPKIPRRVSLKISPKTTVGEFKKMLQVQLQQVAGLPDTEMIEVTNEVIL
jgi:hypothetical protein